ncbi:MAG: outer membrane protein assembly factor [Bacteroidetes bacterium]|nr:outer membrane protein assembly factor [Bacteroidota bacterium]MBS1628863.1 outer membrane protein assembly factor [Bacteroidota bacterium]
MHRKRLRSCLFILPLLLCSLAVQAQLAQSAAASDTHRQQEYEIGGITVSGAQYLDQDLLLAVAGLKVGDKVRLPDDDGIARALRQLWKQDLFANLRMDITRIVGNKVFLDLVVEERPKLSAKVFRGVRKSEATELNEKVDLRVSRVVTDAVKKEAMVRIRKFFVDKGYGKVKVTVKEQKDSNKVNSVILTFYINKGAKTHINQINISGNEEATAQRLKRTFKGTKEMSRLTLHPADDRSVYGGTERNTREYFKHFGFLSLSKTLTQLDPYFRFKLFSGSKYNERKYEEDKQSLIAYYNSLGYRDAAILADTVYPVRNGNLNVDLKVNEGSRYYFGDISWRGNTKYTDEELSRILGIHKGDVYNSELLEKRLGRQISPDGSEDVSSLYMDDGYLFFNIDPVEASIVHDTINYEMRITEGSQATIGQVNIYGNDRTNEHVIRRELRTVPGNKFSRADLIRSQREIANLGFFDQEKIGILPKPHPENGTVDIDYTVVEKSSDQLQLSAGFGGGVNFYGNVGIAFSNFSVRNIFKPKYWDPLPVGDGQKFSINYQSNGPLYNSFNTSFTEPWLGGKKPNALTVSFVYSRYSAASTPELATTSFLRQLGGGVSLSSRLKWPDDNFVLTYGVNYQNYLLRNYTLVDTFRNGYSNNLYFRLVLARYTVDQPLYPRSGSDISFTFQFTPPYSAFREDRDYSTETDDQRYKFIEYHKYRFKADWYQRIVGNLVFKLSTKYGFMGYYNKEIGFSPFERFQLGGDGLSGQSYFIGRDIISQRGYEVYASDATIFNKYTAEVRYPFSLSPTSTIYGLAFFDAANAWGSFKDYNPFKLNRDAGLGIRIFLPMFGLLGLDYGIGFDRYDPANGVTSLKDMSKFTFMLGFEPD